MSKPLSRPGPDIVVIEARTRAARTTSSSASGPRHRRAAWRSDTGQRARVRTRTNPGSLFEEWLVVDYGEPQPRRQRSRTGYSGSPVLLVWCAVAAGVSFRPSDPQSQNLAESWQGGSWSVTLAPNQLQSIDSLSDVSCSSTKSCRGCRKLVSQRVAVRVVCRDLERVRLGDRRHPGPEWFYHRTHPDLQDLGLVEADGMSVLVERQQPTANPFQAPRSAHNARRRASNIAIIAFSLLATAFAVAVLLYLLLYILRQGIPYLNIDLFTKNATPNGEPGGGLANSIQGSLILVGLASLFGIPLGLFTGIYLSEFGGRGLIATSVRFLVDVLAGIPTILFGLFAWIFIVVPQQSFSGLAGRRGPGDYHDPDCGAHLGGSVAPGPKELRRGLARIGRDRVAHDPARGHSSGRKASLPGIVLAMARVAGETARS